MARILTGIQNSGVPHLGNLLGSILPAIELSKKKGNQCFYFIADLHALTSTRAVEEQKENTFHVAAAWLACGSQESEAFLYRQSQVPQTCELMWYLSCLAPFPMLSNAHSFKEKKHHLPQINIGLFTYPVLMAADILLYDIDIVPVGKDQKQHLEICRDIAKSFNHTFGKTFIIPEAKIDEKVMTIPGTDGKKMSKSYKNTIDIFADEKTLTKQVMSIITDSKSISEPKDPQQCNLFQLYSLLVDKTQRKKMRENYVKGNYGYGSMKKELLQVILEKFASQRKEFSKLMKNRDEIQKILIENEKKVQLKAQNVLQKVRNKLGFDT